MKANFLPVLPQVISYIVILVFFQTDFLLNLILSSWLNLPSLKKQTFNLTLVQHSPGIKIQFSWSHFWLQSNFVTALKGHSLTNDNMLACSCTSIFYTSSESRTINCTMQKNPTNHWVTGWRKTQCSTGIHFTYLPYKEPNLIPRSLGVSGSLLKSPGLSPSQAAGSMRPSKYVLLQDFEWTSRLGLNSLNRDQALGPCGSLSYFMCKNIKKNMNQKHYAEEFYWIRPKVHLVQYSSADRSQQQIPRETTFKRVTMQSFSLLHIQSLPRRQLLVHKCHLVA